MDPRQFTIDQRIVERDAHLSPLMRAKAHDLKNDGVNACPFGCALSDLDEHGYCRHLVGFTIPGNDKMMEPMVAPGPDDKYQIRRVKGAQKQPVRPSDHLELISQAAGSRVYRDVDEAALELATRPGV